GDGAGQHQALYVRSAPDQVLRAVRMGYADHVLLDDGSFVQVLGDVVGRRPDELDPSLLGFLVGAGADERGQERVVDVDDGHADVPDEISGDDLHVPGQDD